MRQLDRLFGKLDAVSQRQRTEESNHPDQINRKLNQISATLAQTTQKLDHMAGDFTPHNSEDAGYQAA